MSCLKQSVILLSVLIFFEIQCSNDRKMYRIDDMVFVEEQLYSTLRSARGNPGYRWPNKTHRYRFTDGISEDKKKIIVQQMSDISEVTCIRFQEIGPDDPTYAANIVYKEPSCFADIGYLETIKGYQQNITLAEYGFEMPRIIMHEIMHSLGFIHEMGRPDRDEYLTIYNDPTLSAWLFEDVENFGFPYDFGSIMHYGKGKFNETTQHYDFEPKWPREIGQRQGLSDFDMLKLNLYYECEWTSSLCIYEDDELM